MNELPIKILVADDEEFYTDILTHILGPFYTVYTAGSGREAVEMAKTMLPDLILLDVLMPDITGFGVFEELKNDEVTQSIPVIFITGLDSVDDEVKGFFLGAVDYITKPFNTMIVQARVKTQVQMIKQIRTIERMCMIDTLTDLSNRRGFDTRFELEWERALRSREPISLLFIDMDNFKHYNDTYGHPAGDLLIKTVGDTFRSSLKRATDFVSRWGGDEFAILLPNTDLQGACLIAEEIRAAVMCKRITLPGGISISITISIGVNSVTPSEDITKSDFLAGTDKHLYAAKKGGRNRIAASLDGSDSTHDMPEATALPDVEMETPQEIREYAEDMAPDMDVQTVPETAELSGVISKLKEIPGLYVSGAIAALGGSEELYVQIIRLFHRTVNPGNSKMRASLFEENNLPSFTIKIHGMKSALNQIGYRDLAKFAESLETAGKAGGEQFCQEHYSVFEERLLHFYGTLNDALYPDSVGRSDFPVSPEDISHCRTVLEAARAAAEDFDCDSALKLLSQLRGKNFAEEAVKLLDETMDALEMFESELALECITKLLLLGPI